MGLSNDDDMNNLINMLDEVGLNPVVITATTDEELFRKRLAEAAAALPSAQPQQRVIGTEIVKPAAPPRIAPAGSECYKCGGTGRFKTYSGRDFGECFACSGTGRSDRGLPAGTPSYIKPSTAPVVVREPIATKHYPNIMAAFDAVRRHGLWRAQIRIGDIEISLAGRLSRDPGALYVKHLGEYAGKIKRDQPLMVSHKCGSPQTMMRLLDAIEVDPRAAITAQAKTDADKIAEAVAAGLEPVVPCCSCGILLTDPESRARGIGPICAGKWGLFGFSAPEAISLDDM